MKPYGGSLPSTTPWAARIAYKTRQSLGLAQYGIAEGFGRDCAELVAMARDFRTLHANPERRDLAWRYGVGSEILDPVRRTAEIGNWLQEAAKISSS